MKPIDLDKIIDDFKEPITEKHNEMALLLEKSQVRTDGKITKPPVLLSIVEGYREIDIFTDGNISVIKGKAKSRKSFAVAMILGAYLSNIATFRTFIGKSKKICILFDTEQSSFYVQQAMYRICDISDGSEFETRFYAFCLRPYPPETRLKMIEYLIYHLKPLGLIAIDGVRDLIKDINSPEEATMISSKLLKWTEDTGCHILNVIHENNQDGKARGHIGTELINKAETILRVEKNELQSNVSVISADMVRGFDFKDIYFTVEDNIPMVIEQNNIGYEKPTKGY